MSGIISDLTFKKESLSCTISELRINKEELKNEIKAQNKKISFLDQLILEKDNEIHHIKKLKNQVLRENKELQG